MFEWKQKASNAILLDDNVGGKGKCFRAKFLQQGLVKYSFGVCLLNKEVIDRFVYQFEGCPVIIDHKDVTAESAKDDRVGVISKVWFNEYDSWYWCEGVIFDQEALDLIDKGFNVSCQYEITEYSENRENKLHNGNEYDKTILNGRPEHLAIVQNPRYENAMIAVNAIDVDKQEQIEDTTNVIIQATNEIKETDMFKNLFGKKEKKMEKDEIKAIFLECLTELKASNEAEEKKEEDAKNEEDVKEEEKEAENKCKNADEPDYKKLYEELKAKMEAANEEKEDKEEKDKAKNSIDEQMAMFCKEIESGKSDYVSKSKAIELGSELF